MGESRFLIVIYNEFEGAFEKDLVKACNLRDAILTYEAKKATNRDIYKDIETVIGVCANDQQILNLYQNMDTPLLVVNIDDTWNEIITNAGDNHG